jgi:hypothetical protein
LTEDIARLEAQLEKEKNPIDLKEIENKHQEELSLLKKEHIAKLQKMEKTSKELKHLVETTRKDRDEVMAEIEVIGKEFEEAQEQNGRLLHQLTEKEDTLAQLVSEVLLLVLKLISSSNLKPYKLKTPSKRKRKFSQKKPPECPVDFMQLLSLSVSEKSTALEDLIQKAEAKNKLIQEQMVPSQQFPLMCFRKNSKMNFA